MEKILVGNRCPMCQKMHKVAVNKRDYDDWQGGMSLLRAFPYLNTYQREIIQTGTCQSCWDNLFGGPDEEDLACDGDFILEDDEDFMFVKHFGQFLYTIEKPSA